MTEIHDNPCIECIKISKYGCCTIKGSCGLMLTNDEYDRHFKRHSKDLVIWQSNKFYKISSQEGRVCPHFENGGCRIYHERPLDCRLYPYVMRRFITRGTKVKIVFHTKSDCPDKTTMYKITPETKARELIIAFGKKVYGENTTIIVRHEKGVLSRVMYRIETTISRCFRGRDKN